MISGDYGEKEERAIEGTSGGSVCGFQFWLNRHVLILKFLHYCAVCVHACTCGGQLVGMSSLYHVCSGISNSGSGGWQQLPLPCWPQMCPGRGVLGLGGDGLSDILGQRSTTKQLCSQTMPG